MGSWFKGETGIEKLQSLGLECMFNAITGFFFFFPFLRLKWPPINSTRFI